MAAITRSWPCRRVMATKRSGRSVSRLTLSRVRPGGAGRGVREVGGAGGLNGRQAAGRAGAGLGKGPPERAAVPICRELRPPRQRVTCSLERPQLARQGEPVGGQAHIPHARKGRQPPGQLNKVWPQRGLAARQPDLVNARRRKEGGLEQRATRGARRGQAGWAAETACNGLVVWCSIPGCWLLLQGSASWLASAESCARKQRRAGTHDRAHPADGRRRRVHKQRRRPDSDAVMPARAGSPGAALRRSRGGGSRGSGRRPPQACSTGSAGCTVRSG